MAARPTGYSYDDDELLSDPFIFDITNDALLR